MLARFGVYHGRMPIDLATLEHKLSKRGFRRDDLYLHECTACHEQAVSSYKIYGKVGGRDIKICQACGIARSWRAGAGMEQREEDLAFDLATFLA